MCQTLATSWELTRKAPVNSKFDTAALCPIIDVEEEKLFRECLGMDFYNAMFLDLKPTPTNAYTFVEQKAYNVGDFVVWNGVTFECLVAGSFYNVNEGNFRVYPKFNNANYQFLWERYLCKLISWTCICSLVTYKAIEFTNTGLMRNKTEYSDSATLKDLSIYKNEFEGDIRDLFMNMDAYLKRNAALFPLYLPNTPTDCGCEPTATCASVKRRNNFGFNVSKQESKYCCD
jgi:hypothetical protein